MPPPEEQSRNCERVDKLLIREGDTYAVGEEGLSMRLESMGRVVFTFFVARNDKGT